MPVKLLNKLSGWVRLWLIFTISWGGWFLYQGITSANELQEARHYLDEGLKDYIKREHRLNELKEEHQKIYERLRKESPKGMYRYNFEVDGNYQELVGDMRFQKDELAHLSERMESISNWASKSRHNLEQAYTLGPLVPILLFILYRIIKWISKGFGNSVTSKALQTNETSNSIQDLSAPLNSSIPSANQSEATPSQALLVPPEGKHRNASRVGMRYLLAILACGGIFILYAVIAGLLEWKHGGGAIPIVILLGAIGSTWHAITKKGGDTNSSDK